MHALDTQKESPDRITSQLFFLNTLELRMMVAQPEEAAADRDRLRDFCQRHFGVWAVDFFKTLAREAALPFYRGIGLTGAAFCSAYLGFWEQA